METRQKVNPNLLESDHGNRIDSCCAECRSQAPGNGRRSGERGRDGKRHPVSGPPRRARLRIDRDVGEHDTAPTPTARATASASHHRTMSAPSRDPRSSEDSISRTAPDPVKARSHECRFRQHEGDAANAPLRAMVTRDAVAVDECYRGLAGQRIGVGPWTIARTGKRAREGRQWREPRGTGANHSLCDRQLRCGR